MSKRSSFFLSVLLAAVLAACSQSKTPQSVNVVVEVVSIDSANVKSVRLSITGPNFDQTFTQSVTSGATLRFNPVTLKHGDYTFTARGFSDAAAGGVVLYRTSKMVSVTNSSANLALLMTRTTSNITVTASGVAVDEAVVATSGGISQALINKGDGTATGTLLGVATGDQVFVVAEARDVGGAVVKQGQSATIALSEADKMVGVALNAVGGNALPDSVTLAVTPDEPVAGKPITLNITATDPDGNNDLDVALINWMDGSDMQSQPLTDGTASPTHSYLVAGSYTVTVTVYDRVGASKSASQTITVKQDPDAGVDPATLSTVTINAIAVAADANAVTAKIYKGTPSTSASDLQASYTVSLSKVGSGEWTASLELTKGTQYSLQLFVDGAATGNLVTFTPSADTTSVTVSGGATGMNTRPVAVDDGSPTNPNIVFVGEGEAVNVLANDSDADGDSLVIASVTAPKQNGVVNGTVTIAGDRKALTYTGKDASTDELTTFNYTVSDGRGGTATATVYIFVQSGARQ